MYLLYITFLWFANSKLKKKAKPNRCPLEEPTEDAKKVGGGGGGPRTANLLLSFHCDPLGANGCAWGSFNPIRPGPGEGGAQRPGCQNQG